MHKFLTLLATEPNLTPFEGQLIGLGSVFLIIVIPITIIIQRRRTQTFVQQIKFGPNVPGAVQFSFHLYCGFFVFVDQYHLRGYLPVDHAQTLLKHLVRRNLTWGLFAYGGVLVPFFTFAEWLAQNKRNKSMSHQPADAPPPP